MAKRPDGIKVIVFIDGEERAAWALNCLVPHPAAVPHRVAKTEYDHDAQTMTMWVEHHAERLEGTEPLTDEEIRALADAVMPAVQESYRESLDAGRGPFALEDVVARALYERERLIRRGDE